MPEYVRKDPRDLFTIDPTTEELDRAEEALFLSAKVGTLFEPEMNTGEWDEFCRAATLEEQERRDGVPRTRSSLTEEQRNGRRVASPRGLATHLQWHGKPVRERIHHGFYLRWPPLRVLRPRAFHPGFLKPNDVRLLCMHQRDHGIAENLCARPRLGYVE